MTEVIVVGVDGSATAATAVRYAVELAAPLGARLVLVHVFATATAPPDHAGDGTGRS